MERAICPSGLKCSTWCRKCRRCVATLSMSLCNKESSQIPTIRPPIPLVASNRAMPRRPKCLVIRFFSVFIEIKVEGTILYACLTRDLPAGAYATRLHHRSNRKEENEYCTFTAGPEPD